MSQPLRVITEASDIYFHFTRTAISTLINRNPQFRGKIQLMVHPELPLSSTNLDHLRLLYSDISVIPVSSIFSNLKANSPSRLEKIYSSLKLNVFTISTENTLYFSSMSIIVNQIASLLKRGTAFRSLDWSVMYLDVSPAIFSSVSEDPQLVASSNLSETLSQILPDVPVFSNTDIVISSTVPDQKFNQLGHTLNNSKIITYDNITSASSNYSKIGRVWLEKNKTSMAKVAKLSVPVTLAKPRSVRVDRTLIRNTNNEYIAASAEEFITDVTKYPVSIIIPAFSVKKYIKECLDSIISQTSLGEYEILVGIDNCLDTLNYLNTIKNNYPHLKIYFSNESVGPYIIRNTLTSLAKYDNYLFFDADDIMHKNLLNYIFSRYSIDRPIRFKYLDFNYNPYISTNLHKSVAHGVFFISKNTFNKIGGFQPWKCAADTEFIKRCLKNGVVSIELKYSLFYRRIHSESLTQNVKTNYRSPARITHAKWIENNRNWSIPIIPQIVEFKKIS